MTDRKTATIIGAGPAGLTAAWELLSRSEVAVTVLEKTGEIGGLSRTVNHNGNRIDIGGHRFFSKSDRVMKWWLDVLPLQSSASPGPVIAYHGQRREVEGGAPRVDPDREDRVFLLRQRRSRIYYRRRFFNYPLALNLDTLGKLGPLASLRIGLSYLRSALLPIRPERNLEQFFINRFGRELYSTFFKAYTEKVWGVPCDRISREWGAQRIKGLSLMQAVLHAMTRGSSISIPRIRAVPAVGEASPMSSLRVVVLPAPLGPKKPNTSPSSMVKLSRRKACFGRRCQKPTR